MRMQNPSARQPIRMQESSIRLYLNRVQTDHPETFNILAFNINTVYNIKANYNCINTKYIYIYIYIYSYIYIVLILQ